MAIGCGCMPSKGYTPNDGSHIVVKTKKILLVAGASAMDFVYINVPPDKCQRRKNGRGPQESFLRRNCVEILE